jgi:DNA modification methylase
MATARRPRAKAVDPAAQRFTGFDRKLIPAGEIICGDCRDVTCGWESEQADLIFLDPPFNINYKYDVYDDDRAVDEYLTWCRQWMGEAYRLLKPHGTFWLAIGDEMAAELKIIAQETGFHCRSWVVWHYTFGVNCVSKFTRSHVHLFHFVKDKANFTFNEDQIRVASARTLVYKDKRANPEGRLPDDTWILRPQWAPEMAFDAKSDTWVVSRVAGTFKQRQPDAANQMPEQLLGRIIRACSNKNDLVVDFFAGTATTLAVAKKLGRRWTGVELSKAYADRCVQRLSTVALGDPLDGPVPQGG